MTEPPATPPPSPVDDRPVRALVLGLVLLVAVVGILLVWQITRDDDEDSRSAVQDSVADETDDFPLADGTSSPDSSLADVLVATEDIPACTDSEGWADAMAVVSLEVADLPDGAMVATSVVADEVMIRDVAAGEVIKAQLFGKASKCRGANG